MRYSRSITRAAALGAVAAAVAACAGSVSGPVMTHWTPAPAGASWQVAQRNTGSFGQDAQLTWTREDVRWRGAPAMAMKSSAGTMIVAEPVGGRWISVVGAEGRPLVTYDPPIGWDYPLTVGKSWSQHQRLIVHATGKTIEYDYACKVEDYQKVTVRAGTFDSFRIRCTTNAGTEDAYWVSPGLGSFVKTQLRRDASSPFGAGTQEQELVSRPTLRNVG